MGILLAQSKDLQTTQDTLIRPTNTLNILLPIA